MGVRVIAAVFVMSSLSFAGDPLAITKKNWRTHPAIVEIRTMTELVDSAFKAEKLIKKTKTPCDVPSVDLERTLVLDANARVRKYVTVGGSDDSSRTLEAYYDEAGRMRFVYAHQGAVNGSTVEYRLYFDAAGKRLWVDRKAKGPGYTWEAEWPENSLPRSPIAQFNAKAACEGTAQEIKPE